MSSGRRSAFVIYDEVIYKEIKKYLFDSNQELSRYIWSLLLQDLSKIKSEKENQHPNTKLVDFSTQIIPPRIIEDFEHIIRPYIIKHANIDELKLLMDNGYQSYVMGRYMIEALQRGFIKKEIRDSINISYEQAHNALNWITKSTGSYGIVEREDLR